MARPTRRRHTEPVEPAQPIAEIESVEDIEHVSIEEVSVVQTPKYPVLGRRQRVAIDLLGETSTLNISITGPSSIEISG